MAVLPAAAAFAGAAPATQADYPVLAGLEHGRRVWLSNCFGCHGDGLAGAPVAGNRQAWAPRIAKGRQTLYAHAIGGFFGADSSMMPPRGGNDALSDDDVRAAVDYMLQLVASPLPVPPTQAKEIP